jgi:hypothetical protein
MYFITTNVSYSIWLPKDGGQLPKCIAEDIVSIYLFLCGNCSFYNTNYVYKLSKAFVLNLTLWMMD